MTSETMATESGGSLAAEPADYVMDRMDWYRELLREDPSSLLFCELAEELCAEGLWEEAIRTLREGLHFHPRHLRGHALLGWALWEYGSAEQAERVLDQARRELEKSAVVYKVLGEISTHRGDLEEADRMATLHSLMSRGWETSDSPWRAELSPSRPAMEKLQNGMEGHTPVPGTDRPEEELLDFLTALRDRWQEPAPRESPRVAVFSPHDRKALEQWLRAHAGGL